MIPRLLQLDLKVPQYRNEKRRGWIKLHLANDPKNQEFFALEFTHN